MNGLWPVIGALAAELHPDRIQSIAEAITAINSANDLERTQHAFGPNVDEKHIASLRSAWLASPEISPKEVAAALLAASQTAEAISSTEAIEVVWTGPKTGFIPTRNTEQVILEVIDSAKSDLFLVTYVFYNAPSIIAALVRAVARDVTIKVLLESSTEHGGAVRGDSVKAMADAVTGADIYIWEPASRDPQATGMSAVVHAKCVVADDELAFITSANLTSAALERNMELGALLRGGTAPQRLHSHLRALIATQDISRWEG